MNDTRKNIAPNVDDPSHRPDRSKADPKRPSLPAQSMFQLQPSDIKHVCAKTRKQRSECPRTAADLFGFASNKHLRRILMRLFKKEREKEEEEEGATGLT
ncbi:uncharacterized protein V6R79_001408 [Siganus canaliculatus]